MRPTGTVGTGAEQIAEPVIGEGDIADLREVGAKFPDYLRGAEATAGLVEVECGRSEAEDDEAALDGRKRVLQRRRPGQFKARTISAAAAPPVRSAVARIANTDGRLPANLYSLEPAS